MGVYEGIGIKGAETLVNDYGRTECLTHFSSRFPLGFSRVQPVLPKSSPNSHLSYPKFQL
jgi:hypothetical protein